MVTNDVLVISQSMLWARLWDTMLCVKYARKFDMYMVNLAAFGVLG